jgi:hypothetical protein
MVAKNVHSEPSDVSAEDGEVIQESDAGLAISYTPDAAEVTGQRLKDSAGAARDQSKRQN